MHGSSPPASNSGIGVPFSSRTAGQDSGSAPGAAQTGPSAGTPARAHLAAQGLSSTPATSVCSGGRASDLAARELIVWRRFRAPSRAQRYRVRLALQQQQAHGKPIAHRAVLRSNRVLIRTARSANLSRPVVGAFTAPVGGVALLAKASFLVVASPQPSLGAQLAGKFDGQPLLAPAAPPVDHSGL